MVSTADRLLCTAGLAAIAAIGVAVSLGNTAGIAASIVVPAFILGMNSRRECLVAALLYYGTASWALIPAVVALLGGALAPVLLWLIASLLLASPWVGLWSPTTNQHWWRAPLALAIVGVPPLGLLGWASPLTAAGVLFPGGGWLGLVAAVGLAGALAVRPQTAALVGAAAGLIMNAVYPGDPKPPLGWQGFNTQFTAISPDDPTAGYLRAKSIQQFVRTSNAGVLIFPESVIPEWTEATDLFWQESIESFRASGKTILIGATAPVPSNADVLTRPAFDFSLELAALEGRALRPAPPPSAPVPPLYQNILNIRGVASDTFDQRIPVPVGMWKPFTNSGVPLNLQGRGTVQVSDKRVAVLICYEQLLAWPVLTAIAERPEVLVAVANVHAISATPILRCQVAAVQAWARLFRLPAIFATNF